MNNCEVTGKDIELVERVSEPKVSIVREKSPHPKMWEIVDREIKQPINFFDRKRFEICGLECILIDIFYLN